jgi:predicted nucleic acid-binding protein
MAAYFFDSSALAKRYVTERWTAWVQALIDSSAGNEIYVAQITVVELISAITRRQRAGDLTLAAAAGALADLRSDFASQYSVLQITASLIAQAGTMAEKHALRGYDAVQVAAALQASAAYAAAGLSLNLISADVDLNNAAVTEGLAVDDPNKH